MDQRLNKFGAVMVIGGGIAGIQASLDLAEMGFCVHLVEGSPSIGGRMAQMDRTFPTDEDSLCLLSHQLSQVSGNRNIITFTEAKVLEVKGAPGQMKARVLRGEGEEIEIDIGGIILAYRGPFHSSSSFGPLVESLGVRLEGDGFVSSPSFDPVATSRPGVYVCGSIHEPEDIPRVRREASAAAGRAAADLGEARSPLAGASDNRELPDRSAESPRVGVFICDHLYEKRNLAHVSGLLEYSAGLPFVEHAQRYPFACAPDSQTGMKEGIERHRLNRVVLACSSTSADEAAFHRTLYQAALEPSLFHIVRMNGDKLKLDRTDSPANVQRSKDLIHGAVLRATLYQPRSRSVEGVVKEALVAGGGIAGITAALAIAELGYQVHLVERSADLAWDLNGRSKGDDLTGVAAGLIDRVQAHRRVTIYLNSEVVASEGYLGNFTTRVKTPGGEVRISHGAAVLAGSGLQDRTDRQGFFNACEAGQAETLAETVIRAGAAAVRAAAILAKNRIMVSGVASAVSTADCAACLTCVRICPCGVPYITHNSDDEAYAEIDPAICRACGICAAECPAMAISLQQFTDEQMLSKLKMFRCSACGEPYVTVARLEYLRRRLPARDIQHLDRGLCPVCARRKGAEDQAAMIAQPA